MEPSQLQLYSQIRDAHAEASSRGYPAFVHSIEASTPVNATPYVVGLSEFCECAYSPRKRELVAALRASLAELESLRARPEILLVGGSFLREDDPGDLDCVIYFTRDEGDKSSLSDWQRSRHALGLDVRLVPLDMDPVLVLKTTLFFGVLYTRGKGASPDLMGLLLIDCSR